MKKIASLISILFVLMISLAIAENTVLIESVLVDQEEIILFTGKTATVKTTILPQNATVKKLEWISSDESVATVNNGKIVGISNGNATITVKATDDSNQSASIKVTVKTAIKKITLSDKKVSLAVGASHVVKVSIEPEDATNKSVVWSSSNPSVASVDENGRIVAISVGSTNITAEAADGTKNKASIPVKVEKYDLVFLNQDPLKATYSHGSGWFNIKGSVKEGTVITAELNYSLMASVAGGKVTKEVEVYPLHPGTDTVTIKVNNKQFKYSVFVSEDAFPEPDHPSTDDLKNPVLLEFKSVKATKSAKLNTYDGTYQLQTQKTKDPGTNTNSLSFILMEPLNCKDFSNLTFYIKDLQGSNTHRVTIIDNSNHIHSDWIKVKSVYNEWIRVDVPLEQYASDIDLESIKEIRIGEWNEGYYLFYNLCLTK